MIQWHCKRVKQLANTTGYNNKMILVLSWYCIRFVCVNGWNKDLWDKKISKSEAHLSQLVYQSNYCQCPHHLCKLSVENTTQYPNHSNSLSSTVPIYLDNVVAIVLKVVGVSFFCQFTYLTADGLPNSAVIVISSST